MADYYWIYNGTTAGNFQTAANWSQSASGSPASATIPQANDFVHFGDPATLTNDLGRGSCELTNNTNALARMTIHEDYVELSGSSTEINFLATGYMTSNAGGFDFDREGFQVGMHINITGAVNAGNNGLKQIAAVATNSIQFTSATGMVNETGTTNTVSFTYSPQFDLNGNALNINSPSAGTLLTIHGKMVASSTGYIIIGGTLVGGAGGRFILLGDNADFNHANIRLRITGPAAGELAFDDGEYPLTELYGNSFTTNFITPTSTKYGKTIFNSFREVLAGTWVTSGTRRDNVKKTFEVLDTTNFALKTTNFDTGESRWILNYDANTLNIPVNGDYINYSLGFTVHWYNLEIRKRGSGNGKALIPARRSLQVNSLTIGANAKLVGEFDTAGSSTVCSTTRPTILGSWNFSQVADGIYTSTLYNANPITPSHGNLGRVQFSYGGGAFYSHQNFNWSSDDGGSLIVCGGSFIATSFINFCATFDPSTGSGQNGTIWESNGTPSVLYYTDSAGTHHNLLAGGGGGSMSSFTVAGDGGASQTITDGNTLTIAGATGDMTSTASATDTITLALDNTAVSAGTYGSATEVGQFTVDAKGRITGASNVTISGGGGGATAFTGLTDTPANYTASAGKTVSVNSGATGLEFTTPPILGITIRDEGTAITSIAHPAGTINFVGAGVTATSLSAGDVTVDIPGGGGGGGYPLFKHDQNPSANNFNPFRLLQNGDTIELGVSSGGEDNSDVSVFTPVNDDSNPIIVDIIDIGSHGTNTGREYMFFGQDDRMQITEYQTFNGGSPNTTIPIYFVESMRDVASGAVGQTRLRIYPSTRDTRLNNVRVIDAGKHDVLISTDEEEPELTTVRILLIVDYQQLHDRGRYLSNNYELRN